MVHACCCMCCAGAIPAGIGNLSQLQILASFKNRLTGEFGVRTRAITGCRYSVFVCMTIWCVSVVSLVKRSKHASTICYRSPHSIPGWCSMQAYRRSRQAAGSVHKKISFNISVYHERQSCSCIHTFGCGASNTLAGRKFLAITQQALAGAQVHAT